MLNKLKIYDYILLIPFTVNCSVFLINSQHYLDIIMAFFVELLLSTDIAIWNFSMSC